MSRIRCRHLDVEASVVYGADAARGFPVPDMDDHLAWIPFSVEKTETFVRSEQPGASEERVRVTLWERLDET